MDEMLIFMESMGYIERQKESYVIKNKQAVLYYLRENGYREHHKVTRAGYISRKIAGMIEKYAGRFGRGFVVSTPAQTGSLWHPITYYIIDDNGEKPKS